MNYFALVGAVALVATGQARADCVSVGSDPFGIGAQLLEVCKAAQTALSAVRDMDKRIALNKLSGQLTTLELMVANAAPMPPDGYETEEVAFDAQVLALAQMTKPDRIGEVLRDMIKDSTVDTGAPPGCVR